MNRFMKHRRQLFVALLLAVLVVGMLPTVQAAEKPAIVVSPTWHPDLQLTTLDGSLNASNGKWLANKGNNIWEAGEDGIWDTADDDDFRYAEAQVMVTTTVEFWAVEMTCAVNRDVLEAYTDEDHSGSPYEWHDDAPMVSWGPEWGNLGVDYTDYVPVDSNSLPVGFAATGKMTFTATRVAPAAPLGLNGSSYTFLAATLRFRVKNQGNPFSGNSPIKCTSTFLDRDGRSVLRPKSTSPAPLMVLSGYTIQGSVAYQARAAKIGIGVQCNNDANYTTLTDKNGVFKLSNIRELGFYNCQLFGNISDTAAGAQPDLYMSTWTGFDLTERGSFTVLPVELRGGDLTLNGNIGWDDITQLTSNWGGAASDVNGDGVGNKTDLAIIAGNLGWNDGQMAWHVLYGLPRVAVPSSDSRIWRGDYLAGEVVAQLKEYRNAQYHWPALAPDGGWIAFVRSNGKADVAQRTYELLTADAKGKTRQLIKRTALGYDAFAPSWSPDGTRVAFVRSWYNEASGGYLHNEGYLSVIDADGRNYRPLGETKTGIFPPAWLNDNTLVYGCNQGICLYDLTSDTSDRWSSEIPTNTDMPVIMNGNLYYRMTATGGGGVHPSWLRYAEVDFSNYPPIISAYAEHPGLSSSHSNGTYYNRTGLVHTEVVYASGGAAADYEIMGYDASENKELMDYYDVNWYGNEIMFTEFYDSYQFYNAHFNWDAYTDAGNSYCGSGACYPEWQVPFTHSVDGQISNPAWTSRDTGDASTIHALRNTIDWVP